MPKLRECLQRLWEISGGPSSSFMHGSSNGRMRFEFHNKATHREVAIRCGVPFRHRLAFLLGYDFMITGESDYQGHHYKFRIDMQVKAPKAREVEPSS